MGFIVTHAASKILMLFIYWWYRGLFIREKKQGETITQQKQTNA